MGLVDDARALLAKVTAIRTKAGSLAVLTAGYRQKYRDIVNQATTIEDARAAIADLEASLAAVDGEVAEAVAANTDENDNGIPDRDEPPPVGLPPPDEGTPVG